MKKMSVTVKSAWITGVSVVFAAIISGLLTVKTKEANKETEILEKLLVDIPAGSTVTILVTSGKDNEKGKTEAKIEQLVERNTKLKLIEVRDILNETSLQTLNSLEVTDVMGLVDYIVVFNVDRRQLSLIDATSGKNLKNYSINL